MKITFKTLDVTYTTTKRSLEIFALILLKLHGKKTSAFYLRYSA